MRRKPLFYLFNICKKMSIVTQKAIFFIKKEMSKFNLKKDLILNISFAIIFIL